MGKIRNILKSVVKIDREAKTNTICYFISFQFNFFLESRSLIQTADNENCKSIAISFFSPNIIIRTGLGTQKKPL